MKIYEVVPRGVTSSISSQVRLRLGLGLVGIRVVTKPNLGADTRRYPNRVGLVKSRLVETISAERVSKTRTVPGNKHITGPSTASLCCHSV